MTDILLIQPPFSMPDKPYISVPVLSAYLKSKGVSVAGLDLNIEFFREFLSPEHLHVCLGKTEIRLKELENSGADNVQYKINALKKLLTSVSDNKASLFKLFSSSRPSNSHAFQLLKYGLSLACFPYYPEYLDFTITTGYIRYHSQFKKFSSSHILKSIQCETIYSRLIEPIISRSIKKENPFCVGISLTFPDQVLPTFKCAQIIKSKFPDIFVVMGGAFVSTHMREIGEAEIFQYIDALILDEGEAPLNHLVSELKKSEPDLGSVPNLCYLDRGRPVHTGQHQPVIVNDLPAPDYGLFSLDRYIVNHETMALLFRISRGCYWKRCSFCRTEISFIKGHSSPDAELIFQHLKTVIEETSVSIIHFSDDAAIPEIMEHIATQIIKDKISIKWVANFRFDNRLTTDRLRLYKESGCHSIYLGLESLNPRILKLMNKGITEDLVTKNIKVIKESGIPIVAYMIVGFPTETEDEARESFNKMYEMRKNNLIKKCVYNVFEVASSSPIALSPEKYGIKSIAYDQECDLLPPSSKFEADGMSREKATALCNEFIHALDQMK